MSQTRTWKEQLVFNADGGYYEMPGGQLQGVPVRLFLTPALLDDLEHSVFSQIVTATRFPGVKLVVITPDCHHGYGVPVGCAIVTDPDRGAVALGPVGFDIGCGMVSLRSDVPADSATESLRLAFNRAVMERVSMGRGRGASAAWRG